MELLTISRGKAARQCWRFHFYQYELGRVPIITAEPLFFGTLFHVALEQWWLCWQEMHAERIPYDEDMPLGLAIEAMRLKFAAGVATSHVTEYDLAKCEELIRGYNFRWHEDMADIEIIAVESQFDTPLINPDGGGVSMTFRLGGKIDVRIRRRSTGIAWIVEHKTSTEDISMGSGYWVQRQMDAQITQYIDGARALGDGDVRGCLYDVAKRPMKRPRMATPEEKRMYKLPKSCGECRDNAQALHKATWEPTDEMLKFKKLLVKEIPITKGCETCEPSVIYDNQRESDETVEEYRLRIRDHIADNPEDYYQRAEVPRLEEEMEEFRYDNWEQANAIRNKQLRSRKTGEKAWSRNNDACMKWQRLCDYHCVCKSGGDSIHNNELFRDKQGQHEELGEG